MDSSKTPSSKGFTADFREGFVHEMLLHGGPLYFKMKLVHKGPFVACKVGRRCVCTINGGDDNAAHEWDASCDRYPSLSAEINGVPHTLERAIRGGQLQPIEKPEYEYLLNAAAWDAEHDQDSPLAAPGQQINLGSMKPIF
ncbi:hypothetical protein LCGC14_2647310 [marine sediment metagenome]|uniref:Uncharacterized protein n=1 Tax=marine sediment metagenome TaxID=412755 RepID=A0A0F9C6B2_9ZZZZ